MKVKNIVKILVILEIILLIGNSIVFADIEDEEEIVNIEENIEPEDDEIV